MGFLNNDGVIYLWAKVKALFNKGITGLSVSGRTITFTKGDGTTGTLTTQDTNTTYDVVSKSSNGLAPKLPDETTTTKYLRQDGTWAVPDNNTTYVDMKGATTTVAGTHGLAPAPAAGAANRYLRSDGTWVVPPNDNTTYSDATQTTHGLMSANDKKKLDSVETGANKYVHPTSSGYKHIPSGGATNQQLFNEGDGTARWAAQEIDYTVNEETGRGEISLMLDDTKTATAQIYTANSTIAGLMSASDKTKLDGLPTGTELENTYANKNSYLKKTDATLTYVSKTSLSTQLANYAKKSDITNMYVYKGSVADASKLPTTGQQVGWVYNIETASQYGGAGMNVAWDGTKWDPLGEIFTITAITNAELDTICV